MNILVTNYQVCDHALICILNLSFGSSKRQNQKSNIICTSKKKKKEKTSCSLIAQSGQVPEKPSTDHTLSI